MEPHSLEIFVDKAKNRHKNRYSYEKVNYINSKTKVVIICSIHGEFEQVPNSHLRGSGCNRCGMEYRHKLTSLTTAQFIEKANEVNEYKFDYSKAIYKNYQTPIIITCILHGDFEQLPASHLYGVGCPTCGGTRKLTTDEFISKAKKKQLRLYDYSKTKYINTSEKVEILCDKHGSFWQTPENHLQGQGCPICKESKGEGLIRQFLCTEKINFLPQLRIKECKFKKPLPFDFGIFTSQGKLLGLVEYQGKQHFLPSAFGSVNQNKQHIFAMSQKRDQIKINYCKENKIPLLTIPYTDKEIEKTLKIFLQSIQK